jgi:hypothetical protein
MADGRGLLVCNDMGPVGQVVDQATLATLQRHVAIGHTRYATPAAPAVVCAPPGSAATTPSRSNLTTEARPSATPPPPCRGLQMIRNLPIRTKLIAILIAPLLALTVLASIGIGENVGRSKDAEQVQAETALVGALAGLVHQLQQERDLSAGWVAGNRAIGDGELAAQQAATNKALDAFRHDAKALRQEDSSFQAKIRAALGKLGGLRRQREQIKTDPAQSAQNALEGYSDIIDSLITADVEIPGDTSDQSLIRNVATLGALARLKDALSKERGSVMAVASAGVFNPGEPERLAALRGSQDTWRAQFSSNASPAQRDALDHALGSQQADQAGKLRSQLQLAALGGQLNLDPRRWFRAATAELEQVRGVERKIASDVAAAADAARTQANRQSLIYTIILALILWFTVGLSLWISRSIVGPLQTLTWTANDVAEARLPGLVDRLHRASDPRDLEVVVPEPVPVTSQDEVGQTAAAFNSVHRVAVQVATEQVTLRRSIGDMFLNLARRSQSLIDRQLELIDDLERSEGDPDALGNLFRLDHLATRMRRNAEDLIVLSGEAPPRRWGQPAPLVDVVRAALAEVEDYQRVEVVQMADLGVAGQAVSDVVHLLAELIENATSFSPPTTKVQVAGQPVSNGYVLEVEDRGLGMSDEDLIQANERLADPPAVDFSLSRMLGLYVVGRLAQRYSIKVQLRHSWYGGITALVLLPPSLITEQPGGQLPAAATDRPSAHGALALPPSARPTPPPQAAAGDGDRIVAADSTATGDDRQELATAAADPDSSHLPIFEAARSDWFADPQAGAASAPPPLWRRSAGWPNGGSGVPVGGDDDRHGGVAEAPAGAAAPAAPLPRRPRPVPAPLAQGVGDEQPAPVPSTDPAPVPTAPAEISWPTTKAGLPRRIPQASIAGGLTEAAAAGVGDPLPAAASASAATVGTRSPEQVRSLLTSYREGLTRGRLQAEGQDPEGYGASPSGRDDDATQ